MKAIYIGRRFWSDIVITGPTSRGKSPVRRARDRQCSSNIAWRVSSPTGAETMPLQYTIFQVTICVISRKIRLVKHFSFLIWSRLKFWGIARSPRIRKSVILSGNIDRIRVYRRSRFKFTAFSIEHSEEHSAYMLNKIAVHVSKLTSELRNSAFLHN